MLPKEEFKKRRVQFWTQLEETMSPIRGVHGNKISWLTYKSHVKDLYIRMEFDGKGVRLCLDLQQKDESIRELFYEQFVELKKVMQECFDIPLVFKAIHFIDSSGIFCSRISAEDPKLNFFSDDDLEKGVLFLKNQLISLDQFWDDYKDIFIALSK